MLEGALRLTSVRLTVQSLRKLKRRLCSKGHCDLFPFQVFTDHPAG